MAVRYYPSDILRYPPIVKSVIETTCIYMAQTLYADEIAQDFGGTMNRRFLYSNISAGNDVVIGDATEKLGQMSGNMPFTAYNVDDRDDHEEVFNFLAAKGIVYEPNLKVMIATWPKFLNMFFVTFFNRPEDYDRARTLLDFQNATLTRLDAPILIRGEEKFFPVDVSFSISKGNYAFQFEEYMRTNKILDIVHNVELSYFEMFLPDNTTPGWRGAASGDENGINEVENIYLSVLARQEDGTLRVDHREELFEPPRVSSITPADGSSDVELTSYIVIEFNRPMFEAAVNGAFSVSPPAPGDIYWSNGGRKLTYIPVYPLEPETYYTVTIDETAEDVDGCTLSGIYTSSFTTGDS